MLADPLDHLQVALGVGIGVAFGGGVLTPFHIADGAPSGEVELALGAGEVEVLAAVDERRTGGPHVDLFGAMFVEPLDGVLELGAADDGVLAEHHAVPLDQLPGGDELHHRHEVAGLLVLGHEAPRPGGRILDEGARVPHPGLVGVADGVGRARIGHPGHQVDLHVVPAGQRRAAPVPDRLDIDPLVMRRRVSVIDPQERTDLHPVARRGHLLHTVGGDEDDLARAEIPFDLVLEVRQCAGLEGDRPGVRILRRHDRRPAQMIAGRVDPLVREQEDRTGPHDPVLCVAEPLDEGRSLVDEGGDDLRGVHLVLAHLRKMGRLRITSLFRKLLGVLHNTHRHDRIHAQVRVDDKRLVLVVADHTDAAAAAHLSDVILELGTELGGLDVVNVADEPFSVVRHQPTPLRPQVGMIIGPVKQGSHTIFLRDDAEKTAHSPNLLHRFLKRPNYQIPGAKTTGKDRRGSVLWRDNTVFIEPVVDGGLVPQIDGEVLLGEPEVVADDDHVAAALVVGNPALQDHWRAELDEAFKLSLVNAAAVAGPPFIKTHIEEVPGRNEADDTGQMKDDAPGQVRGVDHFVVPLGVDEGKFLIRGHLPDHPPIALVHFQQAVEKESLGLVGKVVQNFFIQHDLLHVQLPLHRTPLGVQAYSLGRKPQE